MADDQDESQKTEEPTPKKLEEAVKKGQVIQSRELSSFLLLLTLAFIVSWLSPHIMRSATLFLEKYISLAYQFPMDRPAVIGEILTALLKDIALILFLPALALIIAAISSSLILQGRFIASVEPITPKLSKISPLKGLKRLFSARSLVEFLKGVFKLLIVGTVGYLSVAADFSFIGMLHTYSIAGVNEFILAMAIRMLIGVCSIMAVIAGLDYLYQRFEYYKNLRMSKQDIKDEYKQSEGNPEVKAKLKAIRAERAKNRMMAALPEADVVITNPTHFSVALKYDLETMQAPTVIAKGQDNIALIIREKAAEYDIPVVSNPPLARALHKSVEIEQEIPLEHYKAVAEVIGYVYRLKNKKMRKRLRKD